MHIRGFRGSLLVASAFAILLPHAAAADAWSTQTGSGRCWTISQPRSFAQSGIGRGPAYAAVQNSIPDGIRGSFSVVSGTLETARGEVSLEVDGKTFETLPFGDAAFVKSGAPENSLLSAMRKGNEMKVTWHLPSGRVVTDIYTLAGFGVAKDKIDRDCR